MTAVSNLNNNTGAINVNVIRNLEIKVANVDSQTPLLVCFLFDSSDMWIPKESERESAIAIINIPPITTNPECVVEFKPTIIPSVVITPEVKPKLNPFFIDTFNLTKNTVSCF